MIVSRRRRRRSANPITMQPTHVYEVRPRHDRRGYDLISDALTFGGMWYAEPNAIDHAIEYVKHRSRSHDAVIRVYDDAGNVIQTHEHKGEFVDFPALTKYYALVADEFLRAYFVLGLNRVRLHARYFVMGHCLELAFKASLANRSVPIDYSRTHNLATLDEHLVQQGDSCFDHVRPEPTAREVFARMFQPKVSSFIMADWIRHAEALELLLCYKHTANLKYGMDIQGRHILAVTPSTVMMNSRFLGYIACARRNFPNREVFDRELMTFVAGIERKFPNLFSGALAALQLNLGNVDRDARA
jgi:hypothetical protein